MATASQTEILRLSSLLQIEKEADLLQYQQKISLSSMEERRKAGITWYPLSWLNQYISTGERTTIELSRETLQNVQDGNFQVGANVNLFKIEGSNELHTSGVVSFINRQLIRIVLHKKNVPDWVDKGRFGLNLLFDEITYKEMDKALSTVANAENDRLSQLREIMHGNQPAQFNKGYDYSVPTLNETQNKALSMAMNAKDIAIIHGPPGTGKTTTLIQCIKAVIATEKQVLVCAPSNAAVDLIVEKLQENDVKVLRMGHPARLTPEVIENSLDVKISNHPDFKELRKQRKKAEELRSIALQYRRNFGYKERKQREMILKEAKMVRKYSHDLEDYIVENLFHESQVIACTMTGANQGYLRNLHFKTIFLDECSQAMEPASWIPVIKGDRVIMAGDHCQLPPTVKSYEAAKNGLELSLFERAINSTNASIMLNIQYRMGEVIKGFSSGYFYKNELITAQEVLNRENPPVMEFIDTAGCGFEEKTDPTSLSTYNEEEGRLLINHLANHLPNEHEWTGIIAPYKAQLKVLTDFSKEHPGLAPFMERLKINTVDAFQGQERDVIYISMVRSNERGEIGFLKEYRRMNVALTRAKSRLVIIGDSATLGHDRFYQQLLDYIANHGVYKSAFEFDFTNI